MNKKIADSTTLFPKWTNRLALYLLLGLGFLVTTLVFVFWYWFSPKNLDVGYAPKQPIPYSHKLHAGELGIDCRYCHSQVEKSHFANIPPVETCMNCHSQVKTDSPHIKKLKEHYDTNTPIEWVQVHQLPDYAYFDHSAHVGAGVSCKSCHGRVDQMEVVEQVEPLSMGWCLSCHRNPEAHVRPKSRVTDMSWESENQLEQGRQLVEQNNINPREDCNTCHR